MNITVLYLNGNPVAIYYPENPSITPAYAAPAKPQAPASRKQKLLKAAFKAAGHIVTMAVAALASYYIPTEMLGAAATLAKGAIMVVAKEMIGETVKMALPYAAHQMLSRKGAAQYDELAELRDRKLLQARPAYTAPSYKAA